MRFLVAPFVRTSRSLSLLVCGAALSYTAGVAAGGNEGEQPPPFERGKQLFTTNWKPNLDEDAASDGLGPLYNETSCVACHKQGGVGGAGENKQNVVLLTRLTPTSRTFLTNVDGQQAAPDLGAVHPAFKDRSTSSIVLHAHHTKPTYGPWRRAIIESANAPAPRELNLPDDANLRFIERDGVVYMLSERSAPSLFGAGVINRISAAAIQEEAARQSKSKDSISGIVTRVGDDVGRFGWRGQIASLREFVAGACANELGLTVDKHRQASDPLSEQESTPGVDMEYADVNALAQFVAALPRPVETDAGSKQVTRGRTLFRRVGCARCHLESLDGVDGIYSDLLLHDLGPRLSDVPIPAATTFPLGRLASQGPGENALLRVIESLPSHEALVVPTVSTVASYYGIGGSSSSLVSVSSEWRTPPLWGVADTAPYLHDGRAATLEDAIAWHGGEAAGIAERYQKLPKTAKLSLIDFLESLEAP